jgi:hypothetical protein
MAAAYSSLAELDNNQCIIMSLYWTYCSLKPIHISLLITEINLYGKTSPDNNEIRKRIKKLELERVLMKIRTPITENRRNVPT